MVLPDVDNPAATHMNLTATLPQLKRCVLHSATDMNLTATPSTLKRCVLHSATHMNLHEPHRYPLRA